MRFLTPMLSAVLGLFIVAVAFSPAMKLQPAQTALDTDREFDAGSGIAIKDLTATQIANLVLLGKVWGFVKYHHPLVTAGKKHWDYELFRIMPPVLNAADAATARSAIRAWIEALGDVPDCTACAKLNERELHLRPRVTWLTDDALGPELGATLRAVHRNRSTAGRQHYLSLAPNAGNPSFDHELPYANLTFPDAGYRLLALYRFWNIIEYWFPYRDVIGTNWDETLSTFIPRVAATADAAGYKRELLALIASVHDTHANLWSSLDARPPVGTCHIPVIVRFIENKPIVTGYLDPASGRATGLEVGDILEAVDGVAVTELVTRWTPYYAASNEPTRLRDIGRSMTRGDCAPVSIRIARDSETVHLKVMRQPEPEPAKRSTAGRTNDRPGDTFRKLSPEVAYLKLSSVKASEATTYIDSATGTKGLVIDIRNYPSEFVVFALGSHLVERSTPFARFTTGDPANPGAFHWTPPLSLQPASPRYTGKILILVDEVSQSQSEYTTMAFRAAPDATVVGSTTAGADGNVSPIPLPGGLRSMISGIGVFYPDKTPTQRIGIIPDIEARPTIRGIRAGRDEVLEVALRQILGAQTPAAELERLAKQ